MDENETVTPEEETAGVEVDSNGDVAPEDTEVEEVATGEGVETQVE